MTKVTIRAAENGPLIVSVDGQVKMALCRCGQSANKPLCDGTHHKIEFKAERKDTTVVDTQPPIVYNNALRPNDETK